MSQPLEQELPVQFTEQDIEIDAITTAYDGYFKIKHYHFRHRLFNGGWSETLKRELFERGHAVGVLLFDPTCDQVVLVEQIRVGAIAAGCAAWQLEIVAGMIDDGQSAIHSAEREVKEESGMLLKKLIPLTRYLSTSGGSSETIALFLGIVDTEKAGGVFGLAEEHEDIRVHVVSFEQAMHWVRTGKIENAATLIALQWLALDKTLWQTGQDCLTR